MKNKHPTPPNHACLPTQSTIRAIHHNQPSAPNVETQYLASLNAPMYFCWNVTKKDKRSANAIRRRKILRLYKR